MSHDLAQPVTVQEATARAPAAPRTAITWLVDNADAYRALLAACRAARESIWMTQLAFDADCVAWLPDDATAQPGEAEEMRLADVLLRASERAVDVRILLNASLLLDTAAPLRKHFAAAGADASRLRIRGVRRFPQLLHAKIVVVDGHIAFLVGSPFANGYWDDSHHVPVDARRPARELGGRPLHDLSVRLTGAAATMLGETFADLWNGADDIVDGDAGRIGVTPAEPRDEDGDAVHVVRSAPRPRRAAHSPERAEILPALLAGIASAERLVYVEHQYLSSLAVIDALRSALDRAPALEMIVVLNQNPDVTAYRGWQKRRLAASGLLGHPRVGLFALWSVAPGAEAGRMVINQVFVHSKVVAVDDRWAMVGSANLDGVSLATYGDDFSGWLGRRVFRGVRNFDVAAVVSGTAHSPAVLELRTALWREHLDAPDLDGAVTPAGGWLAHWRAHAVAQAAMLRAPATGAAASPRIVVLPYSPASRPAHQLADAGASLANGRLDVCFDPSWAEVHLSPNWVRNMFG